MPVSKKKTTVSKKSLKKPKKSMKRTISRKISKRTVDDRVKSVRRAPRRVGSPSPSRMKKYQTAYDTALREAVEKSVTHSRKSKSLRVSTNEKTKKEVPKSKGPRAKSEYQLFVQKNMQNEDLKNKSASDRMRIIAAMWKKQKGE